MRHKRRRVRAKQAIRYLSGIRVPAQQNRDRHEEHIRDQEIGVATHACVSGRYILRGERDAVMARLVVRSSAPIIILAACGSYLR